MTHTTDNIALVEVPKGGYNLRIVTDSDGTFLCADKPDSLIYFAKELPPGTWRFVCLSTEMTEKKAEQIVEAFDQVVVTYYRRYGKKGEVCYTALASFASLLTALGCDPAGTYAVCVKNESV